MTTILRPRGRTCRPWQRPISRRWPITIITQADVTALDGLVTSWGKVKTAPRTAIAKRSGQTKTLPQAISDNTSLLRNQLDKQMTKFKRTNPEFFAGYHAARVIVHRRSHHAAKQPVPPAPSPTPPPQ